MRRESDSHCRHAAFTASPDEHRHVAVATPLPTLTRYVLDASFLGSRQMASAASNALTKLAQAAVGIGAGVSLFQASIYNVDGGFRAVMFDRLTGVQVVSLPSEKQAGGHPA